MENYKCRICISEKCKECINGDISLPFDEDHFEPRKKEIDDKEMLKIGIEIVSAMKASVYDTDIESGRIMALEDTELTLLGTHTFEEFQKLDEKTKKMIEGFQKRTKEYLHKQALFIAKIAVGKIYS